jgi:hypothetical protein
MATARMCRDEGLGIQFEHAAPDTPHNMMVPLNENSPCYFGEKKKAYEKQKNRCWRGIVTKGKQTAPNSRKGVA